MNIFVIGCGRWGSLITWYLDHIGHHVTLYGRQSSPRMQSFLATRQNDLLTLPDSVGLTTDLRDVEQAETVIISIGSQSLRSLLVEAPIQALRNKTVVLCMKGLEMGTGERLSVIAGSLLIIKGFDDFVLQPTLYSERVKAHPLEIFLVILIAGSLAGILGMLLAIPSYTVLRVFAKEFFSQFRLVRKLTEKI